MNERHVRIFVQPVVRQPHGTRPTEARGAAAQNGTTLGLAENEIAIDVSPKEHGARDDAQLLEASRVSDASLHGLDAGKRGLDVVGDVTRVDRADALPIGDGKREVSYRSEGRRNAR